MSTLRLGEKSDLKTAATCHARTWQLLPAAPIPSTSFNCLSLLFNLALTVSLFLFPLFTKSSSFLRPFTTSVYSSRCTPSPCASLVSALALFGVAHTLLRRLAVKGTSPRSVPGFSLLPPGSFTLALSPNIFHALRFIPCPAVVVFLVVIFHSCHIVHGQSTRAQKST